MKKSNKQRRKSMRDRVREHANENAKGAKALSLPDGAEPWWPDEKGLYEINVIPYEVTTKDHPDEIEVGELWYRFPYRIHWRNKKPIVCLQSVGKKCPVCEEVDRLSKEYEANKEQIRAIRAKKLCLFNIIMADDKKKTVRVMDWSAFKFADALERELNEGEEENCAFADLMDGLTIKLRVTEDVFNNTKFLKTARIDFIPRPDYDDSILDKAVDLGTILKTIDYDTMAKLFFEMDDDDDDDDDEQERKPKKKQKKVVEKEEDDDDDGEDDDDDEQERKPKKKQKKVVEEEEDDDDDGEDDDDDDDDDGEDDDDDDEGDDDDDDDDDNDADDDEDEDDDDDDEEDDDDDMDEDDEDLDDDGGEKEVSIEDLDDMKKGELVQFLIDNREVLKIKKGDTELRRMNIAGLKKYGARQMKRNG